MSAYSAICARERRAGKAPIRGEREVRLRFLLQRAAEHYAHVRHQSLDAFADGIVGWTRAYSRAQARLERAGELFFEAKKGAR